MAGEAWCSHAAQRHGAQAQGITISREQAETARRRIGQAGLGQLCAIELRDYRSLEDGRQPFDKIASVGMFEHVGLKRLPEYFGIAYRLLRPGGVFLNHGIARSDTSPIRQSSFIDRYVFPDGHLVTLSQALAAAESQGLEVRDVENLREHYELTLRCWVEGLRRNAETLRSLVSSTTYRTWLLYMAGSAAAFHRGDIGVYQVLLSRPDRGLSHLPLTREDWYSSATPAIPPIGRAANTARADALCKRPARLSAGRHTCSIARFRRYLDVESCEAGHSCPALLLAGRAWNSESAGRIYPERPGWTRSATEHWILKGTVSPW